MSPPLPSTIDRAPAPSSRLAFRDAQAGRRAGAPRDVAGPGRRGLLVFAVTLVALYPVDILVLGSARGWPLAVRVGWGLAMVLFAWFAPRFSEPRHQRSLATLQAAVSSTFFLALVHCTGGMASPYFYSVVMLPVIVAVVNPQNTRAILLSGALSAGGTVALVLGAGGTPPKVVTWGVIVSAATYFALHAASRLRRMQEAEARALEERTRREALEQLALSERRRTQSEKLATIGRLATNVVHEINNPLAFIRANVELLQQEVRSGALATGPRAREVAEMFDEVCIGIERIRQITADLKGFTYMDGEEPTECRLAVAVADAARLASLRLKRVARLRVDVPESLPPVYAVHRRLAQVLLNLLVNAGDALEEARVPGAEVRVTGREEGGCVVLLVEDDGPGFAPGVLQRLFEPFFTTKGPELGTGLGLALSREMVEQFGGTLTAENRPEGGARLRIVLPIYTPPPPPEA